MYKPINSKRYSIAPFLLWAQFKLFNHLRLADILIFLSAIFNYKRIISACQSSPHYLFLYFIIVFAVLVNHNISPKLNQEYELLSFGKVTIFFLFFYYGHTFLSIEVKKIADTNVLFATLFSIIQNLIYSGLDYSAFESITCEYDRHFLNGFIRCGPFQEGNYLSAFLIMNLVLSSLRLRIVMACMVGVAIAGSPIGIILCSLYLTFLIAVRYGISISLVIGTVIVILIILMFEDSNTFSKLRPESFSEGNESGSTLERLELAMIGFRLYLENPILGVGIGQYTNYVDSYSIYQHLVIRAGNGERLIANNSYAELLSELGSVGVLVIFMFIVNPMRKFKKSATKLPAAITFIILYFAFPTFWLGWNGVLLGFLNASDD